MRINPINYTPPSFGTKRYPAVQFSDTSQRVNIKTDRCYKIKSLPDDFVMTKVNTDDGPRKIPLRRTVPGNNSSEFRVKDKKVIAIIDDFTTRDLNIGSKRNFTHGELVAKYATAGLEDNVDVIAFDVTGDVDGFSDISDEGIRNALEDIGLMRQNGVDIAAVNMSVVSNTDVFDCKDLSERFRLKLTPENIVKNKQLVWERFKEAGNKLEKNTCKEEEFVKRLEGTQVFKASGNDGEYSKCTFMQQHFASDGAHIVGAASEDGIPEPYSNENPFVTDHAMGTYDFNPVYNEVTGEYEGISDGTITFSAEEAGKWRYKFLTGLLEGTSFASPTKLNQYLKSGFKTRFFSV